MGAFPRALAACLLACCCARGSFAQSIVTFAGGATGDGRPAISARLDGPIGVAIDSSDNLYFTDGHRIKRVSAETGLLTTVAGNGSGGFSGDNGPAIAASLFGPLGIALDAADNLYFVDARNYRVRRVDAKTKVITTVAGRGIAGSDGDGGPATAAALRATGIVVSPSGDLYILDGGNNKIRKVSASTKIITTIAGNGTWGYSGDGGPATAASFRTGSDPAGGSLFLQPGGLAFDSAGSLYVTDRLNSAIRRIDPAGIITTIAGNGTTGAGGDDGPARNAQLNWPEGLAFDRNGNLFISDSGNHAIRKIDGASAIITRYAGLERNNGFKGDGGPALNALLTGPVAIAFDRSGDLLFADSGNARVRQIVAATTIIDTVAGGGGGVPTGDGGPATAASVPTPLSVALDHSGALLIANVFVIRKVTPDGIINTIFTVTTIGSDPFMAFFGSITVDGEGRIYVSDVANNRIRRISASTGSVTTIAGNGTKGFSGDGGPAAAAALSLSGGPGLVVTPAGDLYFADANNHSIRRISLQTEIITTIAGTPTVAGNDGDGGPALSAHLNTPAGIALDGNRLYVADRKNFRVRVVDLATGEISNFAGTGARGSDGDGGPAIAAKLDSPNGIAVGPFGDVYITENFKVRKVSGGIITTVAGIGTPGFAGDGGPATAAILNFPAGVVVDSQNNLFFAENASDRVRAVFACVNVGAPRLSTPPEGARDLGSAPSLAWERVSGAFRYDVYLSKSNPPALAASDVTTTSFTPANLEPGATYDWKVVAKGDPYCTPVSHATSEVRTFTVAAACAAPPAFNALQPANGAAGIASPAALSWQAATGAASYDVYLGTTNPPPLAGSVTDPTYSTPPLAASTTYQWFVVAHAACDRSLTTATPVQSFRVAGECAGASAFAAGTPANGATDVPLTTTLTWSRSSGAAAYDIYFGTSSPPPLYLVDLAKTSLAVSGLLANRTYYWRVVAKAACDPVKSASSAIVSFTTTTPGCAPPPATSISFVPPGNVGLGQTYNISWRDLSDLGGEGFYVVERSLDASFATLVDRQETFATTASFVSNAAGTYYHRVRAIRSCDPTRSGPPSAPASVTVVKASANVVFTLQPQAVVTALGDSLEQVRASFALENLGSSALQVIVGKAEIGSVPFFTIVDPAGGDPVFVTLEPRKPKPFEIRFSGPPNDQAGAYQGIVFVASTGQGLAVTPYAFVNLKVGGGATVKPVFSSQGSVTEYAAFPPFAGDDASRPPLSIDIRNDGETPMEFGGEIGPEVWLVPEQGWNALAIPPHASRTIRLRTQRSRAPNGSALPRYTYFTIRSRSGESARLLVQDNDALAIGGGRPSLLAAGSRSFLVPDVVSTAATASRIRLTNIGSSPVQADLYFTPTGADGFDGNVVKRATIIVPANDVVSLIDPLAQLFNLPKPAEGTIEVRVAQETIGSLLVSASSGYAVPVFLSGEGSRAGAAQSAPGVTADAGTGATLILAETSGVDSVHVRVVLWDRSGARKGEAGFDVPRHGRRVVTDIVKALSGLDSLDRGRIDVVVESGGGAVAALVILLDRSSGNGAAIVAHPTAPGTTPAATFRSRLLLSAATGQAVTVAPMVVNGPAFPVPNAQFRTSVGLTTTGSKVTAVVTYRDSSGSPPVSKTLDLFPGLLLHFDNVLEDLFGAANGSKAAGAIFIESGAGAEMYTHLYSKVGGAPRWTLASGLPLFPAVSDVLTSLSSRRPLYLDGLEQSIDDTRGTRWLVVLDEVSGKNGTISVRLYEAGNRSLPIAERTFSIAAFGQVRLDVFHDLGLDSDERRKDRTNVLCVISPADGQAVVSASGIAIDNRTGDTHAYVFSPNGGIPATGISRVSIVTPFAAGSPKRRIVKP